jgi:hypothetical protein
MALQKTVSLRTVVHKNRLKAGFDARNRSLVYVALGDLPGSAFDIKFFQILFFDYSDPTFFRINRINKDFDAHKVLAPNAFINDMVIKFAKFRQISNLLIYLPEYEIVNNKSNNFSNAIACDLSLNLTDSLAIVIIL